MKRNATLAALLAVSLVGLPRIARGADPVDKDEVAKLVQKLVNEEFSRLFGLLKEGKEEQAKASINTLLAMPGVNAGDIAALHCMLARCLVLTGEPADGALAELAQAVAGGADWGTVSGWCSPEALAKLEVAPGFDTIVGNLFEQSTEEALTVDSLGNAVVADLLTFPDTARYAHFKTRMTPVVTAGQVKRTFAFKGEEHETEISAVPQLDGVPPSEAAALRSVGWEILPLEWKPADGAAFDDERHEFRGGCSLGGIAKTDGHWRLLLPNRPWKKLEVPGAVVLGEQDDRSGPWTRRRIVVTLPPGATGAALAGDDLHGYRLLYDLPDATSVGSGGGTPGMRVDAKPYITSVLYKLYGAPQLDKYWAAKAIFTNGGDAPLKDYRVHFRIPGYADAWSDWFHCDLVNAGQSIVDAYYPILDDAKIEVLRARAVASVEVEYEYGPPDARVKGAASNATSFLGINEGISQSMKDGQTWYEQQFDKPDLLGGFASGDDQVLKMIVGEIQHSTGGQPTYEDEGAQAFAEALFDVLRCNVAYEGSVGENEAGDHGQELKYGRDTVRTKSGTCINLAIFFASVCDAAGIEAHLCVIPGHCFPGFKLPKKREMVYVESTCCGGGTWETSDAFDYACASAADTHDLAAKLGFLVEVNLGEVHGRGILPPELPSLGEVDRAQLVKQLAFPATDARIVGRWENIRHDEAAQTTLKAVMDISRTGRFQGTLTLFWNGGSKSSTGQGSFTTSGSHFDFKTDDGKLSDSGDYLVFGDNGYTTTGRKGTSLWHRVGGAPALNKWFIDRWQVVEKNGSLEGTLVVKKNGTYSWDVPMVNAMADETRTGAFMAKVLGISRDGKWCECIWALQGVDGEHSHVGTCMAAVTDCDPKTGTINVDITAFAFAGTDAPFAVWRHLQ